MNNYSNTHIIAKEGYKTIAVLVVIYLISILFGFISWFFLVLLAIALLVYRNPERAYEEDDKYAFVSPADGTVSRVEKAFDKDGNESLLISIKKSCDGVGVIRIPTDTISINSFEKHGLNISLSHEKSKILNTRALLSCKGKYFNYDMKILTGIFGKNFALNDLNREYKQTARVGFCSDFIIELYMPMDVRSVVSLGDSVKAGESVLGYFQNEK